MKRLAVATVVVAFLSLCIGLPVSFASQVDALLQKLIDKGVISASEAQEIRTETNEDITKTDKQKEEDYKKLSKDNLPDWVKNTKLTGDFRLRYEYKQTKGSVNETNRGRFRLRAGFETQVNDKVKVGFTLATGTADSSSRTNNQSFGGSFTKKSVILDKAYVEYKPKDWVTLVGGKFANSIWEPTPFLWDPDITPEGGAVNFKGPLLPSLIPSLNWFANTGIFVLENSESDGTNPLVAYIQPGLQWTPDDHIDIKAGVVYYGYNNVKNHALLTGGVANNNTFVSRGGVNVYKYNYNTVSPGVEVGLNKPFELVGMDVPSVGYAGVFGNFADNVDASKAGKAWIAGLKFGAKKIASFGDWQVTSAYKALEKDAVLDNLPDDDFYPTITTGVRGIVSTFELGLAKNTSLKVTDYHSWLMANANQDKPFNHFMVDLNYKF